MFYRFGISLAVACAVCGSSLYASPQDERRERGMEKERKIERSDERDRKVLRREERERTEQRYEKRTTQTYRQHREEKPTYVPAPRVAVPYPYKQSGVAVHRHVETVKRAHWPRHTVNVLPHRRPGYVIRRAPSAALTITLGALVFLYHEGLFYERHPFGYVVVAPPIGAVVPVLPVGYVTIRLYGHYYYFYDNIYYVWDTRAAGYRVVNVPEDIDDAEALDDEALYVPGNIIETLPDGAKSVTIDGVQYYRYKGHYFLASVQNGAIVYIVVNIDE